MSQTVFPSMATEFTSAQNEQAGYNPLGSVWDGEDAELLERMLEFYPRKRPKRILDATINGAPPKFEPYLGLIVGLGTVATDTNVCPRRGGE